MKRRDANVTRFLSAGLSESILERGDCPLNISKSLTVIKECGRRLAGLVREGRVVRLRLCGYAGK